jgi:hypothetical protein
MFEQWRSERFKKKLSRKFPTLKISWEDAILEVTPRWGDSSNGGYQFQTKFNVHTNFLDNQSLILVCEAIAEAFEKPRRLEENSRLPVVDLNAPTEDSSIFVKDLFSSDIDASSKILLSISGTYALSFLELQTVLKLLERKKACRDVELLPHATIHHSMDIESRSLLIMPGVEVDFDFYRPISREQIDHFFSSDESTKIALFLSLGRDCNLTFREFLELSDSLIDVSRGEEKLKICSAHLIVAVEIFKNSEIEHIGNLTSAQFLSLAREMHPGQAELTPMHIVNRRPKAVFRPSTSFRSVGSIVEGLNVLADFVTTEELEILEEEVRELNLERRLTRVGLFRKYGNADPTDHSVNTVSPILSVLAEIAVTRGALRYSEVVAFLEELFPSIKMNWETLEPLVKANLINLICECFKEEYESMPFQWVAQLSDYTPLDLGKRILFTNGEMLYI